MTAFKDSSLTLTEQQMNSSNSSHRLYGAAALSYFGLETMSKSPDFKENRDRVAVHLLTGFCMDPAAISLYSRHDSEL